ncbi:MAG: hypothetical protein V3U08_02470 [Nitrospirales bacterium]
MQTVAGINALREALMTPESLVAAFLEEKFGKGFCDRCLAARIRSQEGVQVKQAEVRRAETTLAESGHFRRTHGRCSACREPGDVTWPTQSRAVDLSARR